jgi:basic amino acid/polyamine antiporter, APA family
MKFREGGLVTAGLAGMLGAGIFVAPAPAASVAGSWLVAGLLLAAVVAGLAAASTVDYRNGPVGLAGRVIGAAAIAGAFGAYLAPEYPVPAALGLLAAAGVAAVLGWRPPAALVRAALVAVLAVLAMVVAVGVAIEPAAPAVALCCPNAPGTDEPAGLVLAAGPLLFCFLGFDRARTGRLPAIAVALAVYLAVTVVALRQLGGPRLALSAAPLRDALAAADASALTPLLTAGAAIAAASALLGVLGEIRQQTSARGTAVAVLVAVLAAVPHRPAIAIPAAAVLMLGHIAVANLLARSVRREHDDHHRHGDRGGDQQRAGVDLPGDQRAVAAVPPHRPRDGGGEAEDDAKAAEPDQAEQDE